MSERFGGTDCDINGRTPLRGITESMRKEPVVITFPPIGSSTETRLATIHEDDGEEDLCLALGDDDDGEEDLCLALGDDDDDDDEGADVLASTMDGVEASDIQTLDPTVNSLITRAPGYVPKPKILTPAFSETISRIMRGSHENEIRPYLFPIWIRSKAGQSDTGIAFTLRTVANKPDSALAKVFVLEEGTNKITDDLNATQGDITQGVSTLTLVEGMDQSPVNFEQQLASIRTLLNQMHGDVSMHRIKKESKQSLRVKMFAKKDELKGMLLDLITDVTNSDLADLTQITPLLSQVHALTLENKGFYTNLKDLVDLIEKSLNTYNLNTDEKGEIFRTDFGALLRTDTAIYSIGTATLMKTRKLAETIASLKPEYISDILDQDTEFESKSALDQIIHLKNLTTAQLIYINALLDLFIEMQSVTFPKDVFGDIKKEVIYGICVAALQNAIFGLCELIGKFNLTEIAINNINTKTPDNWTDHDMQNFQGMVMLDFKELIRCSHVLHYTEKVLSTSHNNTSEGKFSDLKARKEPDVRETAIALVGPHGSVVGLDGLPITETRDAVATTIHPDERYTPPLSALIQEPSTKAPPITEDE